MRFFFFFFFFFFFYYLLFLQICLRSVAVQIGFKPQQIKNPNDIFSHEEADLQSLCKSLLAASKDLQWLNLTSTRENLTYTFTDVQQTIRKETGQISGPAGSTIELGVIV